MTSNFCRPQIGAESEREKRKKQKKTNPVPSQLRTLSKSRLNFFGLTWVLQLDYLIRLSRAGENLLGSGQVLNRPITKRYSKRIEIRELQILIVVPHHLLGRMKVISTLFKFKNSFGLESVTFLKRFLLHTRCNYYVRSFHLLKLCMYVVPKYTQSF